jgi:hypothetical protein
MGDSGRAGVEGGPWGVLPMKIVSQSSEKARWEYHLTACLKAKRKRSLICGIVVVLAGSARTYRSKYIRVPVAPPISASTSKGYNWPYLISLENRRIITKLSPTNSYCSPQRVPAGLHRTQQYFFP